MSDVIIPNFGESINSASLANWHVQSGATVNKGDVLVTLETDKVATELEAQENGVITLISQEGDEVTVGTVIATISTDSSASAPKKEQPKNNTTTEQENPNTVITPTPPTKKQEVASIESKPATTERYTRTPMSRLRRTIATKLVDAQHQAAILSTFNECDMSAVIELRKQFKTTEAAKRGERLGFMSFFVKAVVHALQEVPEVNARIDGVDLIQNHYYDISVAIGTEKGLVVPVLRDCDQKTHLEIEKELAQFAERAKAGTLDLESLQGGVFTISNGGTYGSMLSTPILNPPQSGILGMHAIMERPMAINGKVEIRPMMYLAHSYDHRLIDGKQAVTFLVKVKEAIETPTDYTA